MEVLRQSIGLYGLIYVTQKRKVGLASDHFMIMTAKLWWNFRIFSSSLWGQFLWVKYYKKTISYGS